MLKSSTNTNGCTKSFGELQKNIRFNTIGGFFGSLVLLLLIIFIYLIFHSDEVISGTNDDIIINDTLIFVSIPNNQKKTKVEKFNFNGKEQLIPGTDELAGDLKAIADELVDSTIQIAGIDKFGFSFSHKGNFIPEIQNSKVFTKIKSTENEIETQKLEDEIVFAENPPEYNSTELYRNIIYPEAARRYGIEGKVIVKVMINPNGEVTKPEILHSENILLNNSAINAIYKTKFKPAEQNGLQVKCHIIITLKFRLR